MMKIGTSGFRGIIGEDYNKESVCKIIQCLCDLAKKHKFKREIVVGYDNRFLSEMFAKWACEVIGANDIHAKLTATSVPSPLVSFSNRFFKNDLGVMITASHNPYYYNGVKIFSKDGQDLEFYLEDYFSKNLKKVKKYKFTLFEKLENEGKVERIDITKEYVKSIARLLKFKKDINVKTCLNVMNGSAQNCATELKKQLKLNCEIVGEGVDVTFGFGAPIPSEENLAEFRKFAIKNKADFAFATDGDGDRLFVFDEKGSPHDGNDICSLLYYFAVKHKGEKGAFVKNFSFSTLADKVCEKLHTKIIETPVGFKHIAQAIVDNGGIIGAENSGCEVYSHTSTKDGLVVFALLNEIVSYYKKPLSKIIAEMKKDVKYNLFYKEISFGVKDRAKVEKFMQTVTPKLQKNIKKIDRLDGVKYIYEDDTWLLVRFSGTENLLRLVTEQKTKAEVESMLESYKNFVKNLE